MKKIVITLAIAVAAVASVIVINANSSDNNASFAFDFNQADDTMCDMVFDKNGNVISLTTYKWDTKNNTKGDVLVAYNN